MTLLEAHNLILAMLGMPPISSLNTGNTIVSKINGSMDRARKRILREAPRKFGIQTDLTPNADSEIVVSQYLRVIYPIDLQPKLTERNGLVWDNPNNQAYSQTISDAIVVEDVAFAQISSYAWQEYIALEAAAEMSMLISDVDQNYAVLRQQAMAARRKAYNENPVSLRNARGVNSALRGFHQ